MALVTVQRSPSPSNTPESLSSDTGPDVLDSFPQPDLSPRSPNKSHSFSESYFAVKGAALILPQSECPRTVTKGSHGGDIQHHLQSMFYLLRPQDTIKVAVKLESIVASRVRYMAVVSTVGRQDTEESVILGIDIVNQRSTIGLVLPVWSGTVIRLDGDGGFSVTANECHHVFKPVSVQAMWSALQSLIKAAEMAGSQRYFPRGLTHTWITYYEANIKSDQVSLNEWNEMADIESHRTEPILNTKSEEELALEKTIKAKLKDVMMQVDLEEVTSKVLRTRLEQELGMDLKALRHFIDEEMIIILRQMDSPSAIFDYLYLGSEWNASNLEELRENGVDTILNVTREIDNFFPGMFEYKNIRLYDVEQSDLLKHWEDTYKFIKKAKMSDSKVLVHCKMGISRSASTVIAFAMKEYDLSFEEAYDRVKKKRSCIKPNNGFLQQLITYQGILDASRQRHNSLWRSRSTGNLLDVGGRRIEDREDMAMMETMAMNIPIDLASPSSRPRSWSPEDNTAQLLLKTRDLASDDDSSEAENQGMGDSVPYISTAEPLHPAFFSWDDIDDFEMSSRSADSIDEVETDLPSQRKCDHHGVEPTIVLLSHKKFNWDEEVERESQAVDADALTEESEVEDVVGDENAGRPEKGFYDVSMFYVNLAPSEEGVPAEDEEQEKDLNYYLHPDIKIELLFAQQRKHRHIAQLLKLSQRQLKDSPISVPVVRLDSDKTNVPNSQPVLTKLREDDSWIKPVEITPEAIRIASRVTPPTDDTQVLDGATVDESSTDVVEEIIPVDPPSHPDTGDDTYKKEDIPWNAGTVKTYTKGFEELMKVSDTKSRKRSRSASTSSTASSSLGSGDEAVNDSANTKAINEPADAKSVNDNAISKVETQSTADVTRQKDPEIAPSAEEAPVAGKEEENQGTAIRPTSIYETEEIPLEPGIVRRTKEEIESRKVVDVPAEPSLQYSGSFKEKKSEKNQNGATAVAEITPAPPGQPSTAEEETVKEESKEALSQPTEVPMETETAVPKDASAPDAVQEEDTKRCVYHIGQEAVEMPVGLVDKLHREYSERDKSEGDVKDRSQSPLEEEGLEIPSGSVKRQLQHIEKVYKSPASVPATSEASSKPAATSPDLTKPVSAPSTVPASVIATTTSTSTAKITLATSSVAQSNVVQKPAARLVSVPDGATEATSVISSTTDSAVTQTGVMTVKANAGKTIATDKETVASPNVQISEPSASCTSSVVTDVASKSDGDIVVSKKPPSDPLSPDVGTESQPISEAIKEQDICWSAGTVKQQKEAIENKLYEKTGSTSTSRRESQSCEPASLTVKESPLHGSKQSSTQTLEAASEKLTLNLKPLDTAKSPPPEEKQRRLLIIEKNPNVQTSPEKGRSAKPSTKASPIGRSHSLKETKTKVVSRPRSHTDSSTSLEATTAISPKLSPLTSPCSPGKTIEDLSDSDCSEKSDSQSVKDLRGFFETKDANVIDRNKRPASLHGTECSQSEQHKKVSPTSSLDSVAAQNLQIKEDPAGQESISPVRPANSHRNNDNSNSNTSPNSKNSSTSENPKTPTSPSGDSEVKVRRQHGKSHPLTRLAQESGGVGKDIRREKSGHAGRRSSNPVYNTM